MKTERKILEADEFKQEEMVCDGRDQAEGGSKMNRGERNTWKSAVWWFD